MNSTLNVNSTLKWSCSLSAKIVLFHLYAYILFITLRSSNKEHWALNNEFDCLLSMTLCNLHLRSCFSWLQSAIETSTSSFSNLEVWTQPLLLFHSFAFWNHCSLAMQFWYEYKIKHLHLHLQYFHCAWLFYQRIKQSVSTDQIQFTVTVCALIDLIHNDIFKHTYIWINC